MIVRLQAADGQEYTPEGLHQELIDLRKRCAEHANAIDIALARPGDNILLERKTLQAWYRFVADMAKAGA